ncbi:NACHT domain-containing protein [Microcoleus sp. FACHB-53]|nr:NACHT domain-containing protein [Microcoleus sp. FACHB-53]
MLNYKEVKNLSSCGYVMELWDDWDDFLKGIAFDHKLSVEQQAVFFVRLSRLSIDEKRTNQQIANEVIGGEPNTALYAYNKRMKEVFDKLSHSFPEINAESRGKVERTQACLEKAYLEQQNKKKSEAASHAIAPPNWRKVCREMLETQKQNLRRQVTQMGFELNVFVPLGLVDRKQQSRRSSDFSLPAEQGSGFFQLEKEEIIKTYEHDEFLEQVIKQRQRKKSNGKRIAIIGEPGAGKTTLLEAIAFSPKTPGFPIWISLGSLGEKSLEEYLCQKWLKDALKTSDATQQQKALEELFKSGEVLLLLDGVDEMSAPSPVEALAKIRDELTGWVAGARVVLTCRVNVWDASVNALQGFDTYRTLEFSYGDGNKPDQVREFICQWFFKAEKPELGEPLRKKLDEDRHQRIRDLVKNPMRLSLLCQSWYFNQGDLPKTKAALYEQFTRAFYNWKEEQFSTTPIKRKKLNAALGLLAREAIDKEKSRFGIRESFALDVMGEDLFKLATKKLHWLVHIYNDADTGQPIYSFFHPTFQEYFAACAIPNWEYFLNHVPDNPKQGTYRIFEPQWKEVFLLWMGRKKDEIFRSDKELLLCTLGTFKDGCGDFQLYYYRALFLASAGIAEFEDCKSGDLIVKLLFSCGFNDEGESCFNPFDPIAESARLAVLEIDRNRAIKHLSYYRDNSQDDYLNREAIYLLEKLGIHDNNSQNDFNLPFISEEEENRIEELVSLINQESYKKRMSIEYLLDSLKNKPQGTINYLIKVMNENKGNEVIAEVFKKISNGDHLYLIVKSLKRYVDSNLSRSEYFDYFYDIIWHCAQNMNYPDFHRAWHGEPSPAQTLKSQLTNIPSQIQPTDKTYPIAIDTQTLKLETNKSAIAQKFCTKIYRKADYFDIPTVNDAAQLQQYIPRIQNKLQKQNLALILHGCEPNEHLLNFCYSLADPDIGLYIGLITSQPLEQPLKGFLPNQDNLLSAIQSWIDEIA